MRTVRASTGLNENSKSIAGWYMRTVRGWSVVYENSKSIAGGGGRVYEISKSRVYTPWRYSYCSHIPNPSEMLYLFSYTPSDAPTVLLYPQGCSYCSRIPPSPDMLLLFSYNPGNALTLLIYDHAQTTCTFKTIYKTSAKFPNYRRSYAHK